MTCQLFIGLPGPGIPRMTLVCITLRVAVCLGAPEEDTNHPPPPDLITLAQPIGSLSYHLGKYFKKWEKIGGESALVRRGSRRAGQTLEGGRGRGAPVPICLPVSPCTPICKRFQFPPSVSPTWSPGLCVPSPLALTYLALGLV